MNNTKSTATKQGGRSDSKKNGRTVRTSKVDSDEQSAMDEVSKTTTPEPTEKHLIEVDDNNSNDAEQPTVTNWASETKPPGREIIKLEPADAERIDKQTVATTSINDLLRVLILRGTTNQNPALAKGAERLLLQLNCVPFHNESNRGSRFGGNHNSNASNYDNNHPRGHNHGPRQHIPNRNFNRDNNFQQNNRFNRNYNGPEERFNPQNNRGNPDFQDRYDNRRAPNQQYQQYQQYQDGPNFPNRSNRPNHYSDNQTQDQTSEIPKSEQSTGVMRTFNDRHNRKFQSSDNQNYNRRGGFKPRDPTIDQTMETTDQ